MAGEFGNAVGGALFKYGTQNGRDPQMGSGDYVQDSGWTPVGDGSYWAQAVPGAGMVVPNGMHATGMGGPGQVHIAPNGWQPGQQQQSGGNPLGMFAALFGGLMGLFMNRPAKSPTDLSILQPESIAAYPEQPLPVIPTYVPNYGGAKDTLVPHLTGIANVDGRGNPDPAAWGTVKMFPPNAARQLTLLLGPKQYLYCLFSFGYGRVDLSDFRIGDKPIAEYAGTDGLGYVLEAREGTTSDAPITVYTQDVEPEEFGIELKYNEPIIKPALQSADRLIVDCYCPQGLYQTITNSQGELVEWSSSVTVTVEYRVVGSGGAWTSAGSIFISGQTHSIARGYLEWTAAKALYEVKLTRTSGPGAGDHEDFTQWAILRAFDTTTKPTAVRKNWDGTDIGTALTGLKLLSTEDANGQLETFSAITKKYVPVWDGDEWLSQLSANNAWVTVGMLTSAWTAQPIPLSDIDIDSFVEWADYCTAEGFTFNYAYTSPVQLSEAIDHVCAAGCAQLVLKSNGKVGVVVDKPKTQIVQIISPANSWDFEGSITYGEELDALNVEFVNPDGQWQQDTRVVYNDGKDQSNAYIRQTISFIGVTSSTQAWKLGRRKIAEDRLRKERYHVSMDWENLLCERGDLVLLNHDVPQFGYGVAFITQLLINEDDDVIGVMLDQGVLVTASEITEITIRLSDGTTISRQIVGTGGYAKSFGLLEPIPADADLLPERNDLAIIGGGAACLVELIEHNQDGSARLTLSDYAPGVFQSTTGTIPPHETQIKTAEAIQVSIPAPIIQGVKSDESVLLRDTSGTFQTRVQINFTPPPASIEYHQYQVKLSNTADWGAINHIPASNGQVYLTEVQDGQIVDIQIRNVARLGRYSAWTSITNHFVVGKTTPPPAVPVIEIQGGIGQRVAVIRYDAESLGMAVPQDHAGFQWRFGQTDDWNNAPIIEYLTTAYSLPTSKLPSGTGCLMVKAVDVAGNMSILTAILYANFGDPIISNVIHTESHAPAFTLGAITNGTIDGGILKADDDGGLAWTGNDDGPVFTPDDNDPTWTLGYLPLEYHHTYTADTSSDTPMQLTLDVEFTAESFQIWYRRLGTALYWKVGPDADSDPFWGTDESAPVFDPDPAYLLFPGAILVNTNEQIEFRFYAPASSSIQAEISKLDINLDVPDLVEIVESATILSGGSRLSLTKNFRSIKTVHIDIEYDGIHTAVRPILKDRDPELGPLIELFNQVGTTAEGIVHATIQGVAA